MAILSYPGTRSTHSVEDLGWKNDQIGYIGLPVVMDSGARHASIRFICSSTSLPSGSGRRRTQAFSRVVITTVNIRNQRPSASQSLTKSMFQRWFGRMAPRERNRLVPRASLVFLVCTSIRSARRADTLLLDNVLSSVRSATRVFSSDSPRAVAAVRPTRLMPVQRTANLAHFLARFGLPQQPPFQLSGPLDR